MEDIFGVADVDACVDAAVPSWKLTDSSRQRLVHTGIPGFFIVKRFLSEQGAEHVLSQMLAEGWVSGRDGNNQAMRFGDLPPWVRGVQEAWCAFLQRDGCGADGPGAALAEGDRWFDQLIANRYEGAEGIKQHVDLLRFRDGIFGLTLCGTAAFVVQPDAGAAGPSAECFLEPGDAYLLTGTARYRYTHGIPERDSDVDPATGQSVLRTTRISLTLRRLVVEGEGEEGK